jgi:glycosyltransferase involved in cell wall biosynthesis
MTDILISVVIPTFHRDRLLDRCLSALVNQTLDPSQYEIIVVDDGCNKDTRSLVESWAEKTVGYQFASEYIPSTGMHTEQFNLRQTTTTREVLSETLVRLVNLPKIRYFPAYSAHHGPAAARNLGWKMAVGDVIAFTDDDCIPDPSWLKTGLDAIMHGADGVSGRIIVPLRNNPTDYEWNACGLSRSEFITANCFYHKTALETIGGFDERFKMAWREDSDLYFNLKEYGFQLILEPKAFVIHPVQPAVWGISLIQQKKNLYNALLYKKHPVLYRKKLQSSPPLLYYTALLMLFIACITFLNRSMIYAAIAIVLWGTLEGWFCIHRLQHTSRSSGHILEMLITSILIPPIAVFWRIKGAIQFRVLFF